MDARKAKVKRETRETSISVELDVDGTGDSDFATGIRILDHLLSQLSHHGALNLRVSATGPDTHHVVEDVALCVGRALNQALGDRQGIVRMAHAIVPMDDALALVAVDISGRGYAVVDIPFEDKQIADLPSGLVQPIARWGWPLLDEFRPRHPDHLDTSFYGPGVTLDGLLQMLDHLPGGTTDIMCHPGYADAGLLGGSSYNLQRLFP